MYSSVLVANRGEIALRVISTLQDHGIEAVVTASDLDINSLPARRADKVLHLKGVTAQDTYLNIEKIINGAKDIGVNALHPGYGFLAENPIFAKEVIKNQIDFIGPTPDQMLTFGDKIQARKVAINSDTPIVPGSDEKLDDDEFAAIAKEIGFPLLIKASAGGGGRGIRFVQNIKQLKTELAMAKSEAKLAFNDDRVYLEKFIANGRHIEVQILGIDSDKILHFGERDCSMQRKNQKIIEESPAPSISRKRAKKMHDDAINLVKEMKYLNAGTVEFLVDKTDHYFLEVNARIQVEHPVTEFVTGEDLIWRQIQVASGEPLDLNQKDIKTRGHSIEARVYAENPYENFSPSTGKINRIRHPVGPGIRIDSAVEDGDVISPYYDPMISKLIVYSPNRKAAIRKLISTLDNYLITGIHTTVPYIRNLLLEKEFTNLEYHTRYLDEYEQKIPEQVLKFARVAAISILKGSKNIAKQNQPTFSNWRRSGFDSR
ncbi:MAG: Pyruvate carboxylase subunit A [Candidatus Heimdallarchaeota archaeon LC_2]|nr:MAG: Pyruvate carboxylase subunit A [Candidatus Heimdallarchaeota archaeon LC_2]